jgi:penicillin V acylase-like amidase (Ntn superfamily)
MSVARTFTVAQSQEKSYAKLAFKHGTTPDEPQLKEAKFGQWLLDNSSTSFLKDVHHLFDEAEIAKKIVRGH